MTGIVSLPLLCLCTPIPCSLALGQRLSPTSLSSTYPIPVPSSYCLGTYLAPRGQWLLFVPSLLSSWSLLSSSMLIRCRYYLLIRYCLLGMLTHRHYCLALSEARIESAYYSQL